MFLLNLPKFPLLYFDLYTFSENVLAENRRQANTYYDYIA